MHVMLQNMHQQMGIKASEQHIFEKYNKQLVDLMKQELSRAKMESDFLVSYNRNFTEQEFADMLAFYKTEFGQSLLKNMPIVMQESMQLSQSSMLALMPKIEEIAKTSTLTLRQLEANSP